jgi:hypothetical protein
MIIIEREYVLIYRLIDWSDSHNCNNWVDVS